MVYAEFWAQDDIFRGMTRYGGSMTWYDRFGCPVSYLSCICLLAYKINVKAGRRGFGDCLIGLELAGKDMGYILR